MSSSVALETTNFAPGATTLPIITPGNSPAVTAASNISSSIFSDDDITLPNVTNLKEFPTNEDSNLPPLTDFLNYDFESISFDDPEPVVETNPLGESLSESVILDDSVTAETNNNPNPPPLGDFLNYDFESFSFDAEPNAAEDLGTGATAPPVGDFLNYDFDNLNFDTTATDDKTNGSSDVFVFEDYNFDLFDAPKEAVKEESEEYDINDGWLDPDYEYVEKTSAEKRKEDEEFDEEWKSIVQPPPVVPRPTFVIDLNPWMLWGPPLLSFLFLLMVFLPCLCIKFIDDCREKSGKPRRYGMNRLVKNIQRDFYERTSTGEWKKLTPNELSCTDKEGSTSFNGIGIVPVHVAKGSTENVSYTEENETRKTVTKQSTPSGSEPASSSTSSRTELDKISTKSDLSNKEGERTCDVETAAVAKDVDLGDGSELAPSVSRASGSSQTSAKKVNPGTSGDANWSMY